MVVVSCIDIVGGEGGLMAMVLVVLLVVSIVDERGEC